MNSENNSENYEFFCAQNYRIHTFASVIQKETRREAE